MGSLLELSFWFHSQISGSKSLDALTEIDEPAPPVPKKGSKSDISSADSPETVPRRAGLVKQKTLQRSSSPASLIRAATSPLQDK